PAGRTSLWGASGVDAPIDRGPHPPRQLRNTVGRGSMSLVPAYDPMGNPNAGHAAAAVAMGHGSPAFTARSGLGRNEPMERGQLAILARLLDDAGEAIYRDRDAARACIARASALLRDGIGHAQAPAALVRGGLAPWQIARIRAHIDAHLDSTIRMRDLAAIANLSTGHFSRS